jgi:hypothetical protein
MNKAEQMQNDHEERMDIPQPEIGNDNPRITTRATQLAMELSKEKRRLTEELSTLQEEYENLAPTTPTGTVDWYIKWVGVVAVVLGVFLINANFFFYGQLMYLVGAVSWAVVGIYWNDKAVLIGSLIPATATALNIVQKLAGS